MKKLISVLLALSLILSFAGCKDKKTDVAESTSEAGTTASEAAEKENQAAETEKPKSTALEEAQFEEDTTKKSVDKDDGYIFNIKNDKNTVVLEFGDSKAVYHHDGKKVTACEYYVDMGDAEKAAEWLDSADVDRILETDKKVKEIIRKGRYIVYKYNESGFAYHTYEELKNAEELVGNLGSKQ